MVKKKIKIELYQNQESLSKPILCSFPQNVPPQEFFTAEKTEGAEEKVLDFNMYQHKNKKSKKMVIEAENKLMKYRATSFSSQNISKNQTSDYMVGVWDKEKHKIRLIDVGSIFTMTQQCKNVKAFKPLKDNLYEGVDYYEKKNQLVNEFGTKKAQSKMQQLKNNIVEEKNINTEKQMTKILKHDVQQAIDEDLKKQDQQEDNSYLREILPAFDETAKKPEFVYFRGGFWPKELNEFIHFKELYKACKQGKEDEEAIKSKYEGASIANMRILVEEEKKDPNTKHLKFRVRGAVFLTYLLRFYRCRETITMSAKELEEYLGIPKDIADHLLNVYSTLSLAKGASEKKFHYVRNKKMKDKLISHIIVLMMVINNYKINVKYIINALKLDLIEIVAYLRQISAFPKKQRKKLEEDGQEETKKIGEKKRKNEWALDSNGDLMVYRCNMPWDSLFGN